MRAIRYLNIHYAASLRHLSASLSVRRFFFVDLHIETIPAYDSDALRQFVSFYRRLHGESVNREFGESID